MSATDPADMILCARCRGQVAGSEAFAVVSAGAVHLGCLLPGEATLGPDDLDHLGDDEEEARA